MWTLTTIGRMLCVMLACIGGTTLISVLLRSGISASPPALWRRMAANAVLMAQCVLGIAALFADPGIVYQDLYDLENGANASRTFVRCQDCLIISPQDAYVVHCDECGVCIENQHHHCSVSARCVGGRQQYIFWTWIALLCLSFVAPPILLAS